jgi:hypothetical protein
MKLKVLLFCSATVLIQSAQAQDADNAPKKKMLVTEADIYPSFIFQVQPVGTLNDFRKLAPQSMVLSNDYTSYTASNSKTLDGDIVLAGNIGISFLDKKKNAYRNMTLRMGVSYQATGLSSQLSKTTSSRYDTLGPAHGGSPMYLDSVKNEFVSMNYRSEELRLDVSLVFRTKPEARWGLYGGIGFTAGTSISAYTNISSSNYTDIQSTYEGTVTTVDTYNDYGQGTETERFKNKNTMGYSVYVPFGIDYRMANKSEFWKRLHVFYEAKPLVNFSVIDQIGMISSAGIQNGIGLRATF